MQRTEVQKKEGVFALQMMCAGGCQCGAGTASAERACIQKTCPGPLRGFCLASTLSADAARRQREKRDLRSTRGVLRFFVLYILLALQVVAKSVD